jgi:insertion element IS1 protein InsB
VFLLKKKTQKLWIWVAACPLDLTICAAHAGGRGQQDLQALLDNIQKPPLLYAHDDYNAYEAAIPKTKSLKGKQHTSGVENVNGRLRHYLARFKRKTKSTNRAIPAVLDAIALFQAKPILSQLS